MGSSQVRMDNVLVQEFLTRNKSQLIQDLSVSTHLAIRRPALSAATRARLWPRSTAAAVWNANAAARWAETWTAGSWYVFARSIMAALPA
jgi:hypothetical protein